MPCRNPTTLAFFVAILTCIVTVLGQRPPKDGGTSPRPPVVTTDPSSYYYKKDESFLLHCLATGVPEPRYEWFRNDTPIIINGSTAFEQSESDGTSTLLIRTTDADVDGAYHCVAKNSLGSASSSLASVQRARLKVHQVNTSVNHHDPRQSFSHVLGCGIAGSVVSVPWNETRFWWSVAKCEEMRECRWKRLQLDGSDDRRILGPDGSLGFSYVLPEDDLMYKCDVYNKKLGHSITVAYHRLTVNEKDGGEDRKVGPSIMFEPISPVIGAVGGSVDLQCYYSGKPSPVIRWRKLDQPKPKTILGEGRKLTLSSLQPSDEGTYECRAKGTQIKQTIDVKVSPVIEEGPNDVTVYINGDAHFRCLPRGSGPISISWYYNGILLSEPNNLSIVANISSDSQNLTLSSLQVNQTAGISCSVSSSYGMARASGFVLVKERPVTEPKTTTTSTTTSTTTTGTTTTGTTTKGTTTTSSGKIATAKSPGKSPTNDLTPQNRRGPDHTILETTQSGPEEDDKSSSKLGVSAIWILMGIVCTLVVIFLLIWVVRYIIKKRRSQGKSKQKQQEERARKGGDDGQELQDVRVHIVANNNRDSIGGDEDYHSDDSGLGPDDRLAGGNV